MLGYSDLGLNNDELRANTGKKKKLELEPRAKYGRSTKNYINLYNLAWCVIDAPAAINKRDCVLIIAMLYFEQNNRVTGWQTSILT